MKRILFCLLVVFSLTVFAQPQSGNDDAVETRTVQLGDPCKDVEDKSLDSSDGSRSGEEAETPAQQLADDCEDNEPQDPLDVTAADDEEEPMEVPEESDPDDEDFKPSEEISEDYPVPLPSDI